MKGFWVQFKTEMKLQLREPEAVFWGFIFPVLLIIVLGLIFSKSQEDLNHSEIYVNNLTIANTHFPDVSDKGLQFIEMNGDSLLTAISTEKISFALIVDSIKVQFIYANIYQTEANSLKWVLLESLVNRKFASIYTEQIIFVKSKSGEDIRYIDWLVPGVVSLNLFISCAFGIGISVVDDKRKGKLKKYATTPLPKIQYFLVMSAQRLVILSLQALSIILVAYFIFNSTIQGSIIDYSIATLFSIICFMIFGFAIAAISKTIEKAVALSNILFVISMLISGAYFSNAGLPPYVYHLAKLLPVTMSVEMSRGIFSYGYGIENYFVQLLGLFITFISVLFLSSKLFTFYNE